MLNHENHKKTDVHFNKKQMLNDKKTDVGSYLDLTSVFRKTDVTKDRLSL